MSTSANETGMCPHCRTGVRFENVELTISARGVKLDAVPIHSPAGHSFRLEMSACPVCGKPILAIPRLDLPDGSSTGGPGVIYPSGTGRPLPSEVHKAVPQLAADFAEAVGVLPVSRKASAALSRRCLQFILVHAGGATKRDLAEQIDEILPKLPPSLAENVDAIRHVGNFGAHPMKTKNSGEIVDVEDGEAEWLLDVLEELMDFYYVGPARASLKRAALNQKLKDLGKPSLKTP
jgi:Domain of unknown function (DUF4145)